MRVVLGKRREDASHSQRFAKQNYAFEHILHEVLSECGESSHRFWGTTAEALMFEMGV